MGGKVWGCEKGRWGCEEVRGRYGMSVGKCVGWWEGGGRGMEGLGEGKKRCGGREEVWEMRGRVNGVSVQGVGKCVGVWESYD